jgi:hypothetical protein
MAPLKRNELSFRLTLHPCYLPDESAVSECLAKPLLADRREHLRWWVHEGPKLATKNSKEDVLHTNKQARDAVARRVAENEQSACVGCRSNQQSFVVGVATDNPVQDNDVGRFHAIRVRGNVVQLPVRAVRKICFSKKLNRLVLIRGRELEVERAVGSTLQ